MPAVRSTDYGLHETVQHEASRQEWNALLQTIETVLHGLKIIRKGRTLKGKVPQTFVDCTSPQKRRTRGKMFKTLGYDCLLSRHSAQSEEELAKKKGEIEVASRKVSDNERRKRCFEVSWRRERKDLFFISYFESMLSLCHALVSSNW